MPRLARYQIPENRAKLLSALRGGADRSFAAGLIGVSLAAFLGWIDRDPVFASEVEQAEAVARGSKVVPSPTPPAVARDRNTGADRWEKLRKEAAKLAVGLLGIVLYVDGILASKGFPPISPWWRYTLENFYASAKRWLVLRVGRGGGKSSTMCRPTVIEGIFGEHVINPGDIGVWPVLSTDKGEARGRLVTIKAILDALGIEYAESEKDGRPRIATNDAENRPIEFRVYPATVAGASGFSAIGATCDEEAKWKDDDRKVNPASEVLKALRPTFRARPWIHGYRCSSAFSEFGTHYEAVEEGDTANTYVARIGEPFIEQVKRDFHRVADAEQDPNAAQTIREYADSLTADSPNVPTWLANPSIDPIATRLDEPDLHTWLREYGSKPMGSGPSEFFDGIKLTEAMRPFEGKLRRGERFAALDTGSKSNAFALAIVERAEFGESFRFRPLFLKEWVPLPGAPLDIDRKTIPEAARIARSFGCELWITDAYYGTSVELRGGEHGIETQYTGDDPFDAAYEPVRRAFNRGTILLSGCDGIAEAVRQLRQVRSVPADQGRTKIIVPIERAEGGSKVHGDLGVALVRALALAGAGEIDDIDSEIDGVESRYAEELDPEGRHDYM